MRKKIKKMAARKDSGSYQQIWKNEQIHKMISKSLKKLLSKTKDKKN